jgi:uncharacterized secreted protein with C-terminal beta-propeller domain
LLRPTPTEKLELTQIASCDAVKDYVSASVADLILNSGYPACPDCILTAAGSPRVELAAADAGSFSEVTGTNTQESGVDELDLVEADQLGNFYILDGGYLVVANGLPPAALREIGKLALGEAGHPHGLLLDEANARLVVVLSGRSLVEPANAGLLAPEIWAEPALELLFVDVADPSNPVVARRLSVEGFHIAGRRIGSRVHIVSHFTPVMPAEITGSAELADLQQRHADVLAGGAGDADALAQAIRDTVATLVAATDGREYAPELWLQEGADAPVRVSDPACGNIATPDLSMPFALTMVTSVDSDGGNIATLAITNNAWNVYASEQNLYLLQTSAGWWWNRLQSQQTAIYKVSIGDGPPRVRAWGLVDGWAGSSYQLSEYDGHLRVATNRWERDPSADAWLQHNNLYVLGDDGTGRMAVVGSVEGFGVGERIFSARFLEDRGYVVTFRQIDPLFAFDLSRPQDPRLVGELEIPGVSTYIHPLDPAHLLTIGIDGDDSGLNGQVLLQIFDVQDLGDPRLLHAFVPEFNADGFAWTSALYDPHAFNFFGSASVLTIPVQYWANRLEDHFSGFAAFSVSLQDGFAELGRLDHSDLARNEYCPDPGLGLSPAICVDGHYLESANPSRSISAVFDEETFIYTLSDVGMKVSAARDFSTPVAVLPLTYPNRYWWWPLE